MISIREKCFSETLEEVVVNVEMIMNHIDNLANEKEIDRKYIQDDLERSFYDLEINLALLAITIRKMEENDYISISNQMRYDLNALIHSYKFTYKKGRLYATSDKGEESIDLEQILAFSKEVIRQKK